MKKAQGLSLNVIVLAALGLIILVVLVAIFTGTILPYIDGLHSWLCEGTLDDPYDEVVSYTYIFKVYLLCL